MDLRRYLLFVILFTSIPLVVSSPYPTLQVGTYLQKVAEVNHQDQALLREFDEASRAYREQPQEENFQKLDAVLSRGLERRAKFRASHWCPPRHPQCERHARLFTEKGQLLEQLLLLRFRIIQRLSRREDIRTDLSEKRDLAASLRSLEAELTQLEERLRRDEDAS